MKNNFYCKLKLYTKLNKKPKFEILIDDIKQSYLEENNHAIINTSLSLGNHVLKINFLNKISEDTVVDKDGKIIEDLAIELLESSIDAIDFSHIIKERGNYYINNNIEKTYGFMYTNGLFEFEFQTPGFLFLRNINLLK
jgi:hypothetical protein